jgi:hypothetical protein
MSMKNSDDTIGNRSRDLPVCSAVPQTNAPPRAPYLKNHENQEIYQLFIGFINYKW